MEKTETLKFATFAFMFALAAFAFMPTRAYGAEPRVTEPRVTQVEPRIWRCDFPSVALGGRAMRFLVVLPEGVAPLKISKKSDASKQQAKLQKQESPEIARIPVIYFLHGRGRHERTLLENATTRARLLASPCAIVLPYGREGWYMNSPVQPEERYADYIDEVITLAARFFPVGNTCATRAIGGWSMGGYGAMLTACRRAISDRSDNDTGFAAVGTIIGLLDFPTPKSVGGYEVPARFGTDPAEWAARNPFRKIGALCASTSELARPAMRVRIAYATRAPEHGMNERFIAAAQAAGLAPEVEPISGGHSFPVVEQALPGVFTFFENALLPKAIAPERQPASCN